MSSDDSVYYNSDVDTTLQYNSTTYYNSGVDIGKKTIFLVTGTLGSYHLLHLGATHFQED